MTLTISGISLYFLAPLILSALFCLFRLMRGPTSADRIVAFYVFGILVVSFCTFATSIFGRRFLMDIALSWAILGFVGVIALAKYLEGRDLDE